MKKYLVIATTRWGEPTLLWPGLTYMRKLFSYHHPELHPMFLEEAAMDEELLNRFIEWDAVKIYFTDSWWTVSIVEVL